MVTKDVVPGGFYAVHSIQRRLKVVRVGGESPRGGWFATYVTTGHRVVVQASDLRFRVERRDGRWQMAVTA